MTDKQHNRIRLLAELDKKMRECYKILNELGKLEDEEVLDDKRND